MTVDRRRDDVSVRARLPVALPAEYALGPGQPDRSVVSFCSASAVIVCQPSRAGKVGAPSVAHDRSSQASHRSAHSA